jgi:hypothetical protein
MKTESEVRAALRRWVVEASGKVGPYELDDTTPIIERRIITSVQVMDLILFLEHLRGKTIEVDQLEPGGFRSIDAIYRVFFEEMADAA